MTEVLLCVEATASNAVPARITGLLATRQTSLTSLHMNRRPDGTWFAQLVVDIADAREGETLVKRLNRLLDVVRVLAPEPDGRHQRRSLFVTLRPARAELAAAADVARLFGAEVLDIDASGLTLHLNASPSRCEQFLAFLEPHSILDVVSGPICATRTGRRPRRPAAQHHVSPMATTSTRSAIAVRLGV